MFYDGTGKLVNFEILQALILFTYTLLFTIYSNEETQVGANVHDLTISCFALSP